MPPPAAVCAFFHEFTLDVFLDRVAEFASLTDTAAVHVLQIFRNSGEFDHAGRRCPDAAPRVPVYGFDDPIQEDDNDDAMVCIVRVPRHRLPIQEWFVRMKLFIVAEQESMCS
uniref:Uncharacterized protein n=1 Tax=Leersia perrieri TaxID=77586 RepID=A0A0D9WDI1_9ORYZ